MLEHLFNMREKICVVTGGSRGLGKFMAKAFLQASARRVYITARNAAECQATAEQLSEYGECVAMPGNITSLEEIRKLVDELQARENAIHVLVNNAGTGWGGELDTYPEKGWDKVMDLNVKSPFFLTQALLPLLRKGGSVTNTASVVNIGSVAGIIGDGFLNYSYGPSKAAVHQLTRNLAKDLAEDHIRVNAIAPGRFYSKLTEYAQQDQVAYEAEIAMIPLHRWGEENDIAGVAVMLCSAAGAFITGQIIPVDGGTTLVA
ncbi:MAG: SDR family oxidoreductase [Gammaproteobacteria bacterium]|nr:SDR family oxidoreductase [Gammaproteobacteria bacterium]